MPTFASMFAGCGGGDLGLTLAGWECVWANEIDKYTCQIYRKNFGDKHLIEGDVRSINAEEIPKADLFIGGFPCQSFSIAGKRKGFQDTRGTLFFEIARIAEAKRPKLLLLENVKGLLSAQNGYCFWRIKETLEELGYIVEWQVLNSKYFGVPQNRERVFIIGHLRGKCFKRVFPIRGNDKTVNEKRPVVRTLQGGGHSGGLHSNMTAIVDFNQDGNTYLKDVSSALRSPKANQSNLLISKSVRSGGRASLDRHCWDIIALHYGESQQDRIHHINGISPSIPRCRTPDKLKITDGVKIRRLTPVECERLQGLPDNWTKGVSTTQRYRMLGNAMTVNVIQFLGERIRRLCFSQKNSGESE